MNSSRYPRTSDPSVLAAQRGAAMVKSIVGLVVAAGCLAFVVFDTVTVRPSGVTSSAVRAIGDGSSDSVDPHRTLEKDFDTELRLDPSEIADYRSNVHG